MGVEVYFNVSPSFHGVKEANAVRRATYLDQILPAHPQQISTCNISRKSASAFCPALPCVCFPVILSGNHICLSRISFKSL